MTCLRKVKRFRGEFVRQAHVLLHHTTQSNEAYERRKCVQREDPTDKPAFAHNRASTKCAFKYAKVYEPEIRALYGPWTFVSHNSRLESNKERTRSPLRTAALRQRACSKSMSRGSGPMSSGLRQSICLTYGPPYEYALGLCVDKVCNDGSWT